MKWRTKLRLLAVPLLGVLFLGRVPSVEAVSLHGSTIDVQAKNKQKDKDNDDKGKKTRVPEGSAGAVLVLAAGALGGGLLLSRRKRRATAT